MPCSDRYAKIPAKHSEIHSNYATRAVKYSAAPAVILQWLAGQMYLPCMADLAFVSEFDTYVLEQINRGE